MLRGGTGAVAARALCVPRNAEATRLLPNIDHYNKLLLRTVFLDRRGGERADYGPTDSCLSLSPAEFCFVLLSAERGEESLDCQGLRCTRYTFVIFCGVWQDHRNRTHSEGSRGPVLAGGFPVMALHLPSGRLHGEITVFYGCILDGKRGEGYCIPC